MWLVDTLSCLLVTCSTSESDIHNNVNITRADNDSLPVVCWHGVNDNSDSCNMVFNTLPDDIITVSIQIGDSLESDKYNSVFMGMMEQVFNAVKSTFLFFNINNVAA